MIKAKKKRPSLFDQMVDELRNKSEAELKMLYARFFQKQLQDEWKNITQSSDFGKNTESDIIKAIQKNRYHL
ncbi:MAG: hypothetical protein LC122_10245 [Chitinophagales bacterium]|nr:hypothetical protein [Chitinophagales bacterium]